MKDENLSENITKVNGSSSYDVIVIGGGLSGLMAGTIAAKRGKQVLLLEKHATVGGLAAGFTRKGYYFDSGMSRCLAYIRPPLRDIGVKVDLQPQRMIWNIAGCWADYANLERFFHDLSEIFPEEQAGLRMLYEKEVRPAEAVVATLMTDMEGAGLVGKALGMLRIIGAVRTMQKAKPLQESEGNIFGKYLDPQGRAYAFLVEREDEVDYRGEMSFFTKIMKLHSQTLNVYPYNGYQGVADDMTDAFRAHGGEVRTCVDVEKIIIDGGRAVGVEVKAHQRSETIYARNIISCIDLNKVFHRLIGDAYLDPDLLERLEKSKLSRAIPILYLG